MRPVSAGGWERGWEEDGEEEGQRERRFSTLTSDLDPHLAARKEARAGPRTLSPSPRPGWACQREGQSGPGVAVTFAQTFTGTADRGWTVTGLDPSRPDSPPAGTAQEPPLGTWSLHPFASH